jgi:hypothetical protein
MREMIRTEIRVYEDPDQKDASRTLALSPESSWKLNRYRLGEILSYQGRPHIVLWMLRGSETLTVAVGPLSQYEAKREDLLEQGIARSFQVIQSIDELIVPSNNFS